MRRAIDTKLMLMVKSKVMKLLSTTPVSNVSRKGLITKSIIVAAAVVMAVSTPVALYQQAHADQWDDQMSALRSQMSQYQSQANALNAEANTYQAALDQITAQKNDIIAQINLSQQQYDLLQQQINDTQKKIDSNKDALGQILAYMSVDNSISPLEMLASSKNIGDYVDQQNYRSSIQTNLSKTIDQINSLKKKLQKSQKDVEAVMEQQKTQKAQLAAKEAEQQDLVNKTRGDEAAYQQLVSNAQSQIQSAAAQQRAYYASLQSQGANFDSGTYGSFQYWNWSGNQGCGGGAYPYCAGPLDYGVDQYQLYYRECVSYVAWRLDHVYGKRVQGFSGYGMAYQWGQGYAKGATRVTDLNDVRAGDAVVLMPISGFAPVGHLMIVEGVSGNTVHVSQYNFLGTGEYSTMDIAKTGVIFLRFPSK